MARDCVLAIDVGTGSVRAALVDPKGRVVTFASREHDQIVPRYGWSKQRPEDWWTGAVASIGRVLADAQDGPSRVGAVCACGQMHGTVLVDDDGRPTRQTAPMWNDKRTQDLVARFRAAHDPADWLEVTANPPAPAWPGFKLQWLKAHDPEAYQRASAVLMPKDYINLRLTGERAFDITEASLSFLMDARTGDWSQAMLERLDLDRDKLPAIRQPIEILGTVTPAAAAETGLPASIPVLVGGGDYPVALLGSGVVEPGLGSDVTGTSSIITVLSERPMPDPEIANIATATGHWGCFVILDAGGDAMRWARRAFHDNAMDYAAIVELAEQAPAGSDALFFLPYLNGERLGRQPNSRAQFFGLTHRHGAAHLNRAVMDGVAFAVRRHIATMEGAGTRLDRLIATGGGARTRLWLGIKASLYGVPILVPAESEGGVIGCAELAGTATGRYATLRDAVATQVRFAEEIAPDPVWQERYAAMAPVFDRLYVSAQEFYDDLDRLSS